MRWDNITQTSLPQLWCSRLQQKRPPPLHHLVLPTSNQQLVVPLKVCVFGFGFVCVCVCHVCVWKCGGAQCPAPKCVISQPCRVGGCRENPCYVRFFTTVFQIPVHPPCFSLFFHTNLTYQHCWPAAHVDVNEFLCYLSPQFTNSLCSEVFFSQV